MRNITDIPGIGRVSLELLEAAGFHDVESLAKAGLEPLTSEIERANDMLKIAKRPPARGSIEKWIRAAREAVGEADEAPVAEEQSVMPVNFEVVPSVASMLDAAPCAIPFPGRWLAASEIQVAEIHPGILLNRYTGDLEVRIEDRVSQDQEPEAAARTASNQYVQVAEKQKPARREIDVSRLRSTEEYAQDPLLLSRRSPRSAAEPDAELEQGSVRAPRRETNAGKNPNSRRYIRGVLHSNPWSLRIGALVTLLLFFVIPVSLVITPLLMLQDGDPEFYHWVRPWWVVFPFLVPLVGICWLIWAYSCSCRICRQKLFVPKKHRKNAKAHHIPLLGYILPLAFHLLVFQWFRCTHCGTPVRLKR